MSRILLLGGSAEAGALAEQLAEAGIPAVYSYAGAVARPKAQPLPQRIGGFGGLDGLCAYCAAEGITAIIDATHPFAARMSNTAVAAAARLNLPLIALERAPWERLPGDNWHEVADMAEAARHLIGPRIFLGIGRNELAAFANAPGHFLLRLVDAPESPPLPRADWIVARGPFRFEDDLALLRDHAITCVVSKNAGGSGAYAKIAAARALGLTVVMIRRPEIALRLRVETVAEVMGWLAAHACSQLRGV
ncbi:cobalt-precorrin-6A reductase [Paracoccus aminophilus]|nr:cobalt-precorrin-6A reductase [Paracoccus aminophilus]